jgi:hypothetical protein
VSQLVADATTFFEHEKPVILWIHKMKVIVSLNLTNSGSFAYPS